jgi:Leucine-rich repeat (LRR) protein
MISWQKSKVGRKEDHFPEQKMKNDSYAASGDGRIFKVFGDTGLNKWLKSIERDLPKGREIHFHNCTVSGIKTLAQCRIGTLLTHLALISPQFIDADVAELHTRICFPHLESFNLRLNRSGVSDVKVLVQMLNLPQLQSLSFRHTTLTDVELDALVRSSILLQLKRLNISNTLITDIGFSECVRSPNSANLISLGAEGCSVTDAGVMALARSPYLTELHSLHIGLCKVSDAGVQALAQSRNLSKLQSFRLNDLNVTDAGVIALAQSHYLTKLQCLDLARCKVTDAGVIALAQSPNTARITSLDLDGCNVTEIGLMELAHSSYASCLKRLMVNNNKLARLHSQILLRLKVNAPAILRYFRESRLGKPLMEVKIPVLGVGAVGKSVLTYRLSRVWHALTNNPPTRAFDVCSTKINVDHEGKDYECAIRFFDFGGQSELHGAHRFFLADQRNVYIIVVNARLTLEENRLDYWMRMVKHHGGDAPVVIVVTHCDDAVGAPRGSHRRHRVLPLLDADQVSKDLKLYVQIVENYSNRDKTNAEHVVTAVRRAITRLGDVFSVAFPSGFFDLRNWIVGQPALSLHAHPPIERYASVETDFRTACQHAGQTDRKQQGLWLLLLRDLGYVHYVGDRVEVKRRPENSLSDYFFDPEWVKKPVYSVMRLDSVRGIVSGKQIITTFRRYGMSDEEIRRVLALMIECELIFRVRGGDNPDTPDYLIPDQINVRPRGTRLEWTDEPKRKLRWRFRFLPDNLLARLVCRWFDYQPDGFPYFRDDVILTRQGGDCRVRLQSDFNAHTLDLEFDYGTGIESLNIILRETLEDLLDPEGVLSKPLWDEEDLSKPNETIHDGQVTRIAESLLRMVTKSVKLEAVEGVATVVRSIFEQSQMLTTAEKLSFRSCMLFAYAETHLVIKDIDWPKPLKEKMEDVLNWLGGDGAEIRKCLEDYLTTKKPKRIFESDSDSFHTSYANALKKLFKKPGR